MRTAFLLVLGLVSASPALAAFEGPGAPMAIGRVSEAMTAPRKTPAVIHGRILRQTGEERYVVGDASGKMPAKIENEVIGSRTITPETPLKIHGRVKKKEGQAYLDVFLIELLP